RPVGILFAAALTLLDRTTGVFAALRTTPRGIRAYVPARAGTLTVMSVALAVIVGAAGAHGWFAIVPVVAAVSLTAPLLDALAVAIAARSPSLFGFLAGAPWLVAPLLAVPLAWAIFGLDVPPLRLVPTIGAWELLQAGYTPVPAGRLLADAAYLAAWTAGAFAVAVHRIAGAGNAGRPTAASALPRRRRARPPRRAPRRLVPAFIDAAHAFRSPPPPPPAPRLPPGPRRPPPLRPPAVAGLAVARPRRKVRQLPAADLQRRDPAAHALHSRLRRDAAAAGRPRRGRAAGAVGVPARRPRLPVLPDRLHRLGRPLRR